MSEAETAQDMTGVTVHTGGEAKTYTVDTSADVGEEKLLAGKFKSAEEMEEAYLNLQRKLGSGTKEGTEETAEEEAPEAEETAEEDDTVDEDNPYGAVVTEAMAKAELNIDDVRKQYADNDGKLEDETFDKLENAGFPRAMVESYLRGLEAAQGDAERTAETTVSEIKAAVGGDGGLANVIDHVQTVYSREDAEAYNEAINSGDPVLARKAVMDAHAAYTKSVGVEPNLNMGGKTPSQTQGYASENEMIEDMAKPEYKTSQAFRDKVAAKIAAASTGTFKVR